MLKRIRGIIREFTTRTDEQYSHYVNLLVNLSECSPFTKEVLLIAGKREARARLWYGLPLEPCEPDVWAFRVFAKCLEIPGVSEVFIEGTSEQRKAGYQIFRTRAKELWSQW